MEVITSQSGMQEALVADFFALTGDNNNPPELVILEPVTTKDSLTATHGYFSDTIEWLSTVCQNVETISYLQHIQFQAQLQQMACLCGPGSGGHAASLYSNETNNSPGIYGFEYQYSTLDSNSHNGHHCDECGGSIENNKCSKCGRDHHH